MSNPFKDWTPSQVAAYNARERKRTADTIAFCNTLAMEEEKFMDLRKLPVFKLAKAIEGRVTTDEEKLNKLEKRFLARLRMLNYPFIGVQSVTLKLAHDTRFTPDFCVIDQNSNIVCYETKGWMRDDAAVKIKVAARQFPWIKFVLVYYKGGEWTEKEVQP